jgi:hypothetical protein
MSDAMESCEIVTDMKLVVSHDQVNEGGARRASCYRRSSLFSPL